MIKVEKVAWEEHQYKYTIHATGMRGQHRYIGGSNDRKEAENIAAEYLASNESAKMCYMYADLTNETYKITREEVVVKTIPATGSNWNHDKLPFVLLTDECRKSPHRGFNDRVLSGMFKTEEDAMEMFARVVKSSETAYGAIINCHTGQVKHIEGHIDVN